MCTVLIAFQAFSDHPLHIAANRDEQLDRPAQTFTMRAGRPSIFAPRDLEAGGTWIGVNEHGLVAAITNRFGANSGDSRRSRGELVMLALTHADVARASAAIGALDPREYNGFHLTVASVARAETVWSDGESISTAVRQPGLHVVTERSFGAADSPREHWLEDRLKVVSSPDEFDRLLLHEADDGFNGTLVAVPEMNYGTRSSTIVKLGDTPELLHAHGRPDEASYTDFSGQIRKLLQR
jgi:uncharacterized protein with NRDE domain